MLKQCTALFLLLALMASTFSKAVIVVDFYANRDYIAKNLCVNRNRPIMHCGGVCHLNKQLAADENPDRNNPEKKVENANQVVFFEDFSDDIQVPPAVLLSGGYPLMASASPVDRTIPFFHPPC